VTKTNQIFLLWIIYGLPQWGGDSIDENLLPACQTCQGLKKNFLSWEWINLQNAVFSIDPGYEELKGIPWGTRIAKHYFDALSEAESGHIRLKDAFQRIGPITTPISFVSTSEPITFFDLKTS
jgi:membrane protease subunit (stomatin/prohibitin family)